MIVRDIFGILSVVVGAMSFLSYWVSIYDGRTKPHLYSHLVWTILAFIGALAQMSDQAGPGAWVSFATALGSLITTIWAYFSGERHITHGDRFSLFAALLAIPIWATTHDPLWAVFLVSGIDYVGCYPTIRKSWNKPYQESMRSWILNVIKLGLSLLALNNVSMITAFYPSSFLVLNVAFIVMCIVRRRVLVQHQTVGA